MRKLVKSLLIFFLSVSAAAAADSFDISARLAKAGAPQTALARVERDQPDRTDIQLWSRWEMLRLSLLNELNRSAEVLERIAALPAELPAEAAQQANWQGARAALSLGQGESSRIYLSQLLWRFDLADPQYREARRMVAQSYLKERRTDDAYRVMLRYSQDFQPLTPNEAAAFTEGLLIAGVQAETGTWLAQLGENDTLKLLARLRSGLVTPEQAIADARAALDPASVPAGKLSRRAAKKSSRATSQLPAKAANPVACWTVIMHAAVLRKDAALLVEAREQLLNFDRVESSLSDVAVDDLWQNYFSLALQRSNQAQLLLGDDAALFALGEQLRDTAPAASRALFASLAVHAREQALREGAQSGLAALLLKAGLERTAFKLFADSRYFPENQGLSPQARFALGQAAAQGQDYVRAARLWHGLTQPFGEMQPEQWQRQRARVFAFGGAYADVREAARMLPVAELPGTESTAQREILLALGELAESQGDAAAAADYYLQAAGTTADAVAQNARWLAARNLARAGLREDAKKQYLMLLKTAQDAAQQAAIQRALARL
ncbi:MAG: hypothetical protein PHG47_06390 [Sulfuricella sp.]|nr:hypothetical protein [Sulfuricella sp.]